MELVLALEIDRKRNAIKVLSVKHSMMSQLLLISLVHAFSSFSGLIFFFIFVYVNYFASKWSVILREII